MPAFPGIETILIVDDESTILRLTTLMLERYGYRVLTAASGEEVLRLLEIWPDLAPDLAVIDLLIPDMNGVDIARRIKILRPEMSILFCSGFPEEETLRPAFARNIPYIAKPFTSIQLTTKIRELLDSKSAKGAAAGSENSR